MAAVDVFKAAVVRIRDILRGPGLSITGMDSMRHICLYLMARYITRERAAALGIPDQFSWENIMHTVQNVDGGMQFALELVYHSEAESPVTLRMLSPTRLSAWNRRESCCSWARRSAARS